MAGGSRITAVADIHFEVFVTSRRWLSERDLAARTDRLLSVDSYTTEARIEFLMMFGALPEVELW
jgi:hypothetical protein